MNSVSFWMAQFIGVEALLLLLISYKKKETNKMLILQVISSFLYIIHYLLLGAYSGFLICTLDFIRDIMYYKSSHDKLIFLFMCPFYLAVGFLNYTYIVDLLPIAASLSDAYSLTKYKVYVLIVSIITCILWIGYDIAYKSYSGVLTSVIIIISNLSILLFDKQFSEVTSPIHFSERK